MRAEVPSGSIQEGLFAVAGEMQYAKLLRRRSFVGACASVRSVRVICVYCCSLCVVCSLRVVCVFSLCACVCFFLWEIVVVVSCFLFCGRGCVPRCSTDSSSSCQQ